MASAVVATQHVTVDVDVHLPAAWRTSGGAVDEPATPLALQRCRICFEGHTEKEPLIQLACACRGDLGLLHESCALVWFKKKGAFPTRFVNHTPVVCCATRPVDGAWQGTRE
jgi:hypothetical protein